MVVLFDGVCNLCNGFVQFVIKRDKKQVFKFASLQSNYGKELLKHFNLNNKELDTVLLFDGKQLISRSSATIAILTSLGGIWKVFIVFKRVPEFIRNGVYNILARRRYKLFGKSETCMVPTPELENRFVNEERFSYFSPT